MKREGTLQEPCTKAYLIPLSTLLESDSTLRVWKHLVFSSWWILVSKEPSESVTLKMRLVRFEPAVQDSGRWYKYIISGWEVKEYVGRETSYCTKRRIFLPLLRALALVPRFETLSERSLYNQTQQRMRLSKTNKQKHQNQKIIVKGMTPDKYRDWKDHVTMFSIAFCDFENAREINAAMTINLSNDQRSFKNNWSQNSNHLSFLRE